MVKRTKIKPGMQPYLEEFNNVSRKPNKIPIESQEDAVEGLVDRCRIRITEGKGIGGGTKLYMA